MPQSALSPTTGNVVVVGNGGEAAISFRASLPPGATNCSPPAIVSNAAFVTVTFVSVNFGGKGIDNSLVRVLVAPNPQPTPRTGSVSIGDKVVLVNEERGEMNASLFLFDPVRVSSGTTECYIRGPANRPTECIIQAHVTVSSGAPIVLYTWRVDIFPTTTVFRQTTTIPEMTFTAACGLPSSTPAGAGFELLVDLTMTDSIGDTVTVQSGYAGQPSFQVRLFTCGS